MASPRYLDVEEQAVGLSREAPARMEVRMDPGLGLSESSILLQEVRKSLGGVSVLAGIDLSVRTGEFLTLLGPSGVGKSTILNVIAGFLPVEEGSVHLLGEDVTFKPAHTRNLGFIFQEYALFPHLSIERNVRFPLDMRKVKRPEARKAVNEVLEMVGLAHIADRRPQALSGGQRQRVAIARALVFRPQVLLMDEPMSSLDRQLRDEMTVEIRRLQRDLGVTVMYVTHDQTEALSLSDRVGILRDGRIEQIGDPSEVHDNPISVYAARLCGPINVEAVKVAGPINQETIAVKVGTEVIHAPTPRSGLPRAALLGVRPYVLRLGKKPRSTAEWNSLPVKVVGSGLIGSGIRYEVDIGSAKPWQVLASHSFSDVTIGDSAYVSWPMLDTAIMKD